MVQKVKKEALIALPKAESKAKALKAQKAVLKGVHSHKKEDPHPYILMAQETVSKGTPRRNKVDHNAILNFPLIIKSATKKMEDSNAFVFIAGVKANEHQIKQAVKNFYDIVSPDGEKKEYVRLATNYDALDVEKKGII
uniref:Uncharacterized protein n=1 Tax=Myotis lucifugus TaxID=59463 RepID=G1Q1R6_MYOLU